MRRYIAQIISRVPGSILRVLFYRLLFGYEIRNSRIGYGTVILVNTFQIDSANVGGKCLFVGPMQVNIHNGARIGVGNTFRCGPWTANEKHEGSYLRKLNVGEKAHITDDHYFDVAGLFSVGDETWIAGSGSQFWTHGAGVKDRDITIGNECYIGSAVRFAPGASIANRSMVALGSIVTRKFEQTNLLIGGVPAKVIKKDYDWKDRESGV